MNRKMQLISIISFISSLVIITAIFVINYIIYHPKIIVEGENKFKLGSYSLEESGLSGLEEIVKMTQDLPEDYTVSYFEAVLNRNGKIKSFILSIDIFNNGQYYGFAGYVYSSNRITYTVPSITTHLLVEKLNPNSTFTYLSEQIKKIPLKKQIAISGLDRYVIRYQPYTQIESGTPIFDGRNNNSFNVLAKEDYNSGNGGVSDGKTNVVIRLYDGVSVATGQQYLYVFEPIDKETAVGNQVSNMQCDYYINNGILKFTKNYGESWTEADITKDELNETMNFYRNYLSLPNNSLFISTDEALPIAYFYSVNPKLKILHPDAESWQTIDCFPNAEEFGRDITKRVIGFVDSSFGYAALGTDWSMGAGENKMCYFTFDGGNTWIEKSLPLQISRYTLIDLCMANEKIGVLSLDSGSNDNFPLIFVTDNTADDWIQIELPYYELPKDIQYLTDIEDFEYSNGQYILTLGQEEYNVNKVVFTSNDLKSEWQFSHTYKSSIHTVG